MQLCCSKSRKREGTPRLMVMASWLDFFVVVGVRYGIGLIVLLSRNNGNSICIYTSDMSLSKCRVQGAKKQRSKKKNSSGVEPAGSRST